MGFMRDCFSPVGPNYPRPLRALRQGPRTIPHVPAVPSGKFSLPSGLLHPRARIGLPRAAPDVGPRNRETGKQRRAGRAIFSLTVVPSVTAQPIPPKSLSPPPPIRQTATHATPSRPPPRATTHPAPSPAALDLAAPSVAARHPCIVLKILLFMPASCNGPIYLLVVGRDYI